MASSSERIALPTNMTIIKKKKLNINCSAFPYPVCPKHAIYDHATRTFGTHYASHGAIVTLPENYPGKRKDKLVPVNAMKAYEVVEV